MNPETKQRIEQIKKYEIPTGYKKTKAGIMPIDWNVDIKAKNIFANYTDKKHSSNLEILAATQEKGIVPRSQIDIDIKCSEEGIKNYKRVRKGNFVISLRSFQGGIEYSNFDGIVSPAYTVLKPICPISDEYYKNYFKTDDFIKRLNGAIYGIRDGKQIGYEDFSDLILHNPPLEEQQKISEILMQCDKVIELYKKEIDELKKLKKACLRKMFPKKGKDVPELRFAGFTEPWEQRKLSELGEILTGSTPSTSNPNYYSEDGIPWVTPTDIVSLTISDTPRKLSEEGANIARVVPANTILCTCIASIGKNTLLTLKGSFNQQINSLTPNEENDAYFLLTESELWSDTMGKMAASGTMQIVNKSEFSELRTMIPLLTEQRKIGAFFWYIDNLITLHQRKLEEQQKQKKSLMQLLLTGIVRVK